MKTVFLIDDHPVVAMGLGIALKTSRSLTFVGAASDPLVGYDRLEATRPACVILDLVFKGGIAETIVEDTRGILPDASIVVFSSLPARLYARDCIRAGADVYVGKDTDLEALIEMIETIMIDKTAPPLDTAARDCRVRTDTSILIDGIHVTPREAQVAAYVGRGLSINAISKELGMSPNTVAAHRDNIRRKLSCRDTKELVARLARLDQSDRPHL